MKTLRLLFCCLLCPVLLAVQARGQSSDAEAMRADVTARLTEFYAFYCHGLTKNQDVTNNTAKMKPYVSTRFLKKIYEASAVEGGLEADPFVCAQDTDPAWEKNIKVANVKSGADGKTASADVTLGGMKEMVRHLRISLVNEGGILKVDKVKDADLK